MGFAIVMSSDAQEYCHLRAGVRFEKFVEQIFALADDKPVRRGVGEFD